MCEYASGCMFASVRVRMLVCIRVHVCEGTCVCKLYAMFLCVCESMCVYWMHMCVRARARVCVHACARGCACACVCVRACMRACERACVRACVCLCVCNFLRVICIAHGDCARVHALCFFLVIPLISLFVSPPLDRQPVRGQVCVASCAHFAL